MSGFVRKFKDMWAPPEDDYDDDYDENPRSEPEARRSSREREEEESGYQDYREEERYASSGYSNNNKVVNMHQSAQLQVVLFKPEHFGEDTRAIADELLKIHTVVLNLETTQKDVARRIIDFLSGVAYANGGKIKRVATDTFIITPYNVDLTGDDLLDEIESNGMYF